MITIHRRAWLFAFLALCASTGLPEAADKNSATLLVKDALTSPNQAATVEAKLVATGLLSDAGLGGEPLELVIDGKVVATAMTGGDGKALLSYTPKAQGLMPVQVRVGASPRVTATDGEVNLAVWERRHPILMVEIASLREEPSGRGPLPGISLKLDAERKPMPGAAEVLGKLTQFYYHVIYVATMSASGRDGFQANAEARQWLKAYQFPPGYVLILPDGEHALGAKIDEFHAEGWRTVKTGIGRSRAFAEAFLRRRLEAVMVPEPVKGEAPRKAKVAREWKEVRKKL